MQIKSIAFIYNNFSGKFGIPRQSGLTKCVSQIVFDSEYKNPDYIKGLDQFSHIWLIWGFSANGQSDNPTVRPPRLGGNERVGVFASRSPYRPNGLGLTLVKIRSISTDGKSVVTVEGADMLSGTPIYDIKPYIDYADKAVDPICGFAPAAPENRLKVELPADLLNPFVSVKPYPETKQEYLDELIEVLSFDPRPAYHDDPERIYGLTFGAYDVKFKVKDDKLTVLEFLKYQA